MQKSGVQVMLMIAGAGLMLASGCADPRVSNQGGGSLLSAGTKAASGNLAGLTADEWQILLDNAPSLASQFGVNLGDITIPVLSDDQAAQLTDCVNAAGITSFSSLDNLSSFNVTACKNLASLF